MYIYYVHRLSQCSIYKAIYLWRKRMELVFSNYGSHINICLHELQVLVCSQLSPLLGTMCPLFSPLQVTVGPLLSPVLLSLPLVTLSSTYCTTNMSLFTTYSCTSDMYQLLSPVLVTLCPPYTPVQVLVCLQFSPLLVTV